MQQLGKVGTIKIFITHYLVLSPGLLYVDTVILGLLLCLYRDAMWNVLRLYGIGGRLLRGVKSFYVGS